MRTWGHGHYLFDGVIDVVPVPEILSHVTGNQVVFRNEREETASSVRVSGVHGGHLQVFHALAHFNVLGSALLHETWASLLKT
jgi:hypothetical protein